MKRAGGQQRRHGLGRMAAAALVAALAVPVVTATPPANAASSAPAGSSPVSIDVVSMSPSVPAPSQRLNTLTVELSIVNHTNARLNNVQISAIRAPNPLTTPHDLTSALADPVAPTNGKPVTPVHPVAVDLPPASDSAAVTTTFVTTTAVPISLNPGLCLCADGQVYPVWFRAYSTARGVSHLLGQTQTFVPSFDQYHGPNPLHVSWLWPLIDRPHRLIGSTTFTDDSLASSISSGRLRRCLQVLKKIAATVPVTVVIDPELLDELHIMANQKYTYRNASGQLVAGTGGPAARMWLAQLQAVLKDNNQLSVVLTPTADPDVDSLARAGLSWSATLSAAEQQRVRAALGGATVSTGFAWPPSDTIGHATLRALYGTGVRSLLLSSASVQPNSGSFTAPLTLARLSNGGHPVVAALTSRNLSRYVAAALGGNPTGTGFPALMARLTLLAGPNNPAGQQVFLTPPRYVDPAVSLAAEAIERSSSSVLTRPANIVDVLAAAGTPPLEQAPAAVPAQLVAPRFLPPGLPPKNLRVARDVTNGIASLKSMFDGSTAALALVNQLSGAVQRIESAAWRHGSGLGGRRRGVQFATQLRARVDRLTRSVFIVPRKPSRPRRYTLASTNSPLPITVENQLPYPVHVKVAVRPVNGIPGLQAQVSGLQEIPPNGKTTLRVPTQVQRSGLFRVYAVLQTPRGRQIGPPVRLLVSSTALGTIGVVITVVSGGILLLALLLRFVRRMRSRRPQPARRRGWAPPGAGSDAVQPQAPVTPLTETLATPGAAPPPAGSGN